jgi:hypothetical protein
MDVSKLFAVEFNLRQQDWRIDTLDKVLQANYEYFLGRKKVRLPSPFSEPDDWILLGVCSSLEEANALAAKFEEIRDRLERDIQEARRSYIASYPGAAESDNQE